MNDRTLPTTEADLLAPIERLLSLPPNRFLLMEWSRTDPAGPDEARPDPTVVFATLYQSLLASCRVRPAKALEALQHLRSSRAAEELPASRPALSRLEAHAQSASGRMEIALDLYANAADEYRKLGLSLEEAKTRSGWTFALASVGRPREAERVASTAAKLVGSNEPLLRARLETNVATGWYNVGRFDRARDRYRNALRAFENAGATQDAALVSHNLGTVSLLLGETREAEALCARSEAFFHGIGAVIPELTSRAIRLVAGLGHGRWDEGVAKMASLREELQARGDARAEAWLHRELAGFFASVGVLEAAIPDARAASEMFAEVGLELDAAHASFVYGRLLAARGERQEALVHLHRAHRFWQRSESVAHTHRVGVEIARLYLAAGHLEEARRWLLRSRAYLDKHDPHGEGARARALVAELHLERGRPRLALGLALGAYRSATQFPAMLERPQMALVVARAHARLGHASDTVRWARIAVRRLESLLMRFGNRRLRILVGDSRDSVYRQAVDLVIASGASRAARIAVDLLALARSPLVVEDLQHAAGEEFRPEVRGAMVRLRAELLAKAPEARTEGLRVRSLQDQMRRLDRLLLEGPTKPPMLVRRAMANRSLARWLPGLGTREVVFFDRGTPWRAFVIRPNGEVVHVELPFAQGALAESWLALRTNFDIASRSPAAHRSGFIDRTTESCLHHLGQLRRALWDPLPLTHERIVVVPIGELHGVPLEALGDEAGHIVSRTPHPALLSRGRSHRPRRALVLAGEDAEMEAEAREAASILEQTGWTVVRSDHVDVEMARGGAIGLLHVAAHGTFHREGWLFSGIDLPHGRLYFEDLRRTRLRDALILLTSCDSGRVDSLPGSNVEGWITAGLSAGARELVLAGWKIDGGNARRFAHEFHRRWNGAADAAPAVAFGRASLRARHPHPHGWAGYMVAG